MSVYSKNHGDTEAVRLVVMNDYGTYKEAMRIVGQCWWDEEDGTWNDIEDAAEDLCAMVSCINRDADGFTDLQGVDYDQVDWQQLIRDELHELNLQEGRDGKAGLS